MHLPVIIMFKWHKQINTVEQVAYLTSIELCKDIDIYDRKCVKEMQEVCSLNLSTYPSSG